jgi:hypothetical protein
MFTAKKTELVLPNRQIQADFVNFFILNGNFTLFYTFAINIKVVRKKNGYSGKPFKIVLRIFDP